eukprot:4635712-Ditylum_brightwellii.AAC.1
MVQYKLFPKVFLTATLLDGLGVVEINGVKKSQFKHFVGALPKFSSHLRTWGEVGTIKTHKKITQKNDRGITCMFVVYATDHEGDCYKMYNPSSGIVYESCDILWLKRMYYAKRLSALDDDELQPWSEDQDLDNNAVKVSTPANQDTGGQEETNDDNENDQNIQIDIISEGETEEENGEL